MPLCRIKNVVKVCSKCDCRKPVAYYLDIVYLGDRIREPICVDCHGDDFLLRRAAKAKER